MNLPRRNFLSRGFTLIECMAYLGVFVVILSLALLTYYRCMDNYKNLHSNADDIARVLLIGEQWRNDVRAAIGTIHFENDGNLVRIPQQNGEVAYKFSDGQVLRKTATNPAWIVVLPKVRRSQMEFDARGRVTAARWELELQPSQKRVRVRPAFSFFAVPGATIAL